MRPRRHLVIFLRAPRLGRVKSRLATGIGAIAALRFYRQTSERLLRVMARDARWQVHLAATPDRDVLRGRDWRVRAARFAQGMGDLGARMEHAVRGMPPGPVVIIGSDIPALGPAHVGAAFAALGTHHAVFGPAADGGYWLVGFRRRPRLPRPLFPRVAWSSPHALADSLAGLPADMHVAFLETLEDIDDAAAYWRWRETLNRQRRTSNAP